MTETHSSVYLRLFFVTSFLIKHNQFAIKCDKKIQKVASLREAGATAYS